MRLKRLLLLLTGILAISFSTTITPASAQQTPNPYLALDELQEARTNVSDMNLVGMITWGGELSHPNYGKHEGFDVRTGRSWVWGYQFLSPSGSAGVTLLTFKYKEGDNRYAGSGIRGIEPDSLDLSGNFTNSDAFVEQLHKNRTFDEYSRKYPDVTPESIELRWQPDSIEQLPNSFPLDKPIWGIYYNTSADLPGDSTMICFVSSGQGETHCIRFEVSSVDDPSGQNGGVRLNVAPNPVNKTGVATLQIESDEPGLAPDDVSLYNMLGEQVIDLKDRLVPDGLGGFTANLNLVGLVSGSYVCRVVRGNRVHSIHIMVD